MNWGETDSRLPSAEEASTARILMYYPDRMSRLMTTVATTRVEKYGLKAYHVPFVVLIGHSPGISQKTILNTVPFDKSRVSIVVNELIAREIVVNESNSKVSSLVLTDLGQDVYEECADLVEKVFKKLFEGFTAEEKKVICDLFQRMESRIDDMIENGLSS